MAGLTFAFFSGGNQPLSKLTAGQTNTGLEGEESDGEHGVAVVVVVVELEVDEDNSGKEGDTTGQTRTPVLVRLLLAFAGTGVLKQGRTWLPGSASFSPPLSVETPVGKETVCSEKDSSTK